MTGPRCQGCGQRPAPDTPVTSSGLPWTWSFGLDHHQRRTLLCQRCTRENTRSIEARLDDDGW